MRRREFLSLVGGTLTVWPVITRAQQSIPVVGFLNSGSAQIQKLASDAYRQGLEETGFVRTRTSK